MAETQYLLSNIVTVAASVGTWNEMPLRSFYLIIKDLIIYELIFLLVPVARVPDNWPLLVFLKPFQP